MKIKKAHFSVSFFVRMKGLEPTRLAALDPKSSASTNSATSALKFGLQRYYFLLVEIKNSIIFAL